MIQFQCRNCGTTIRAKAEFAGKVGKCPKCAIVGHDGRPALPDADFFHQPPGRIGAVLSAATTRTKSSRSQPTRRLHFHYVRLALLGAALLFPAPIWMVYAACRNMHSPLALFFICAGGLVSVVIGSITCFTAFRPPDFSCAATATPCSLWLKAGSKPP
jgi:hypothetical protein